MSDSKDADLKALASVLEMRVTAVLWHQAGSTLAPILRAHELGDDVVVRFTPPPAPRPTPAPDAKKAKAPARKPIWPDDVDLAPLPAPIARTAGLSLAAAWSSFATTPTRH